MKEKNLIKVFAMAIVLVMAISLQSMAQNQTAKSNSQVIMQNNLGYCLDGIALSPELQAKISKLQQQHQAAMTPLRLKLQGTRDWTGKAQVRKEMDALKATNQEEIWKLVPEARGKSLNLRQGTGRGQGYPGQGYGRAAQMGNGQQTGYGRGAGYNRGVGYGIGAGRGRGAGIGRGGAASRGYGRGAGRTGGSIIR